MFSKMAAKYGDVFTLYVGSRRMIVLNKYDVIKEALLKTPRIFDVRSDMFNDLTNGTGKTVIYSCITLKHTGEQICPGSPTGPEATLYMVGCCVP